MNTALLLAILALALYIAYRVTPGKPTVAETPTAPVLTGAVSNVVMFPSGDPVQLLEILNADGHCIARRPAGHPDLEWARNSDTVTVREMVS